MPMRDAAQSNELQRLTHELEEARNRINALTETQTAAAQDIESGGLLGDQDGLPLWENDDTCGEFQGFSYSRQIAE